MKPATRPSSSTSNSSTSSTPATNGTKTISKTPTSANTLTSPPTKTKTLATPAKTRPTMTPSKIVKGVEKEAPKPVTIPELYNYIKRELLQDESSNPERDAVIKNKILDSFKDGLNVDEDLAKARERIAGPCEAARAESKQIQEDTSKQTTILRRKYLEEEGKNQRLQTELDNLKKNVQDLTNRLVLSENLCSIEKNQNSVLLQHIVILKQESVTAAGSLQNMLRVFDELHKSAVLPGDQAIVASQQSPATVNQQVLDAENAIKNLTDILKNTEAIPVQEPDQDIGGDLEEEGESAGDETPAEAEPNGVAEHANGESDGSEYESEDDEVIHVNTNGKPDEHHDDADDDEQPEN